MGGRREEIEEHILDLDACGEHEIDADIGEGFDVSGRRVGQIREQLFEDGRIDQTSDFAPREAKREAGREYLTKNPEVSAEEVANEVGVTVDTARKIRSEWVFRKEVEWQSWMEGETLFPYRGSKASTVCWILWKVPESDRFENPKQYTRLPDHEKYVEVFAGSAAVLVNKEPSKTEVLNDANPDVADFFETLRDHGEEMKAYLRTVPFEEPQYDEWVHQWYRVGKPNDDVKRAAMFFYLRFTQWGRKIGGRAGFNRPKGNRPDSKDYYSKVDRLPEFQDRLEGVLVENRDFRQVLTDHDGPETLFYLDPPYVGKEDEYPDKEDLLDELTKRGVPSDVVEEVKSHIDERFPHDRLVETLKSLEGRWMLSYGEKLPEGLEEYRHEYIDPPNTTRSKEHLVMSFEPEVEGTFDPSPHGNALDGNW